MKVLDLFSGIGGFSLGLERAGHTTMAFCNYVIDEIIEVVTDYFASPELVDRVAKVIADSIGHGMREKCEVHAKAVIETIMGDASTRKDEACNSDAHERSQIIVGQPSPTNPAKVSLAACKLVARKAYAESYAEDPENYSEDCCLAETLAILDHLKSKGVNIDYE